MNPYKARGLYIDHGELHKLFFYDAVVNGVFSLMLTEIKRAFWHITRYRNETSIERKKRELLEMVFGLNDRFGIMGGGIIGLIENMFWAQLYGFSLSEILWDWVEISGERFLVPVDARYRHPASIYRWIYHGERLIGCTQLVQTDLFAHNGPFQVAFSSTPGSYAEVFIPIDKCLLYSNMGVDGNPEGVSAFRTAFIWVKYKLDKFQRKAVAEEHLWKGIVKVQEQGDERGPYRMITQSDRDTVKTMLNALAQGRTNRIVVPYGLDINVEWPTYNMQSDIDEARWIDHQIMMGSSSSLLGLDATRAASRGLNDSLATVAYHAIEGVADDIKRVINGIPGRPWTGLVAKMMQLNFPGTDGRTPWLSHFGISYQDTEKLVDTLAKASQMLLYAPDEYDEDFFRVAARINKSDIQSITKQREKITTRNGQLTSQAPQNTQARQNQPRSQETDGNGNQA